MKRRSFLQAFVGAVAAAFVPATSVSKQTVLRIVDKHPFHEYPKTATVTIKDRPIFSGDICVWDGAKYRPARYSDDLNLLENRVAIAAPDGNGGLHYMREGIFAVQVAT